MGLLVKTVVTGDVHGPRNISALASKAMLAAVEEVAHSIEEKGRDNITSAGNFGSRWTSGFKAEVSGDGDTVSLNVMEAVPYWTVFQFGKVIQGKPLLFFKPTVAPAGLRPGAPMPSVIAKHSVTIPKKFSLIEIATKEAERVPLLFAQKLAEAAGAEVK